MGADAGQVLHGYSQGRTNGTTEPGPTALPSTPPLKAVPFPGAASPLSGPASSASELNLLA
jgi:hypothetical protein